MRLSQGFGALAALAVIAGCTDREPVLEGVRQDPRTAVIGTEPEPGALAPKPVLAQSIALPAAQANADWTARAGNSAHHIAHVALPGPLSPLWTASIGAGEGRKNRIAADPVVAGGRIFTLDANATVTATGTNGATLWQADLTPAADRAGEASGGGIAFGEGRVFVTTGFGELVALDPATGGVAWRAAARCRGGRRAGGCRTAASMSWRAMPRPGLSRPATARWNGRFPARPQRLA